MKRYKVNDILKMLKKDGWKLERMRGSHRQFKHPVKPGTVTVNGKKSDNLSQANIHSIHKQAGWKE